MFYDNLSATCKRQGLKVTPVVKECGGASGSISAWKKGATPNSDIVLKLSVRLNVSTDYLLTGSEFLSPASPITDGERLLLNKVSGMSETDKIQLAGAIPIIVAFQRNPAYHIAQPPLIFPTSSEFELSIYDMPASAGTGLYLDSEDYTVMTFPADEVPQQTSFGVRLRGDSMMPDYEDGDIVFLKRQPELQPNEIGIFMLDGNAYCKKYIREEDRRVFLKSLNPKYPPIHINEYSDLRVLGKVIGKFREHI